MICKPPSVTIREVVKSTETRNPAVKPNVGISYVDIAAVSSQDFRIHGFKRLLGRDAPSRARKVMRAGDVLVATTRPYLRTVATVPEDLEGEICSTGFCVLRASEAVLSEWIFYFCLSEDFMRQVVPLMRGANYPAVTDKDILNAAIPLPPVAEQRRIVARIKECMDRVEEMDKLRATAHAESDAVFPSVLAEAFSRLEAYPRVSIGSVALETRYGTSRKCTDVAQGIPILRIPNVAQGIVNFDNLKYCRLDPREEANVCLKRGDLLFVRTNGSRDLVGRCAMFDSSDGEARFGFASYLIRVRLNTERMRPKFLAYFLNSTHGRRELDERRRTSAGQFNINSENLRTIPLPCPPIELQDRLIELFAEQERELQRLRAEVAAATKECGHLRDAILRKAFAGEL